MASLKVSPLSSDLPFGVKISGITWDNVKDKATQAEVREIFDDRGMIVFEDMERSTELQIAVSEIFGPPQVYAIKEIPAVDGNPGVIELKYDGNEAEENGKPIEGWVPWHYDACYTNKLNRGGILRAVEIPPEGGLTGFADGIQMYKAISPQLRAKFESLKVIYHSKLMHWEQRFGMPKDRKWVRLSEKALNLIASSENAPRSYHPAIWTRKSGEHVLHVSPWQAAGILGHLNAEGDALLEELCQEMYVKMTPYWHAWRPTDMVIWDNWRFLHTAGGNDPKYSRCMLRTTITGDYGLGGFEKDAQAA